MKLPAFEWRQCKALKDAQITQQGIVCRWHCEKSTYWTWRII